MRRYYFMCVETDQFVDQYLLPYICVMLTTFASYNIVDKIIFYRVGKYIFFVEVYG